MQVTALGLEEVIKAIHAAPPMVVIEFAGAGAQALAWLHGVGGSSRTILEATDRYAASSLIEAIGFKPALFTSPEVARAMATRAYLRAHQLADPGTPVAGIGCTATIATERVKQGQHRCCVAVCMAEGITSYTLSLAKGRRTRQEEETLVSLLILKAIADVCGVEGVPALGLLETETLTEQFEPIDLLARLLAGELNWVAIAPASQMATGETRAGLALLSGSFNPLHQGHRQMARVAAQMLGQEVYFELPLINADKTPIGLVEARRRVAQFADWATVILTQAPLFSQKAHLFPQSVFVIGMDTAQRLVEPRFYHDDPIEMRVALSDLRRTGCRFLVAGRLQGQRFLTLKDLALPAGYQDLFIEIPEERFRMDVSSTALREEYSL